MIDYWLTPLSNEEYTSHTLLCTLTRMEKKAVFKVQVSVVKLKDRPWSYKYLDIANVTIY